MKNLILKILVKLITMLRKTHRFDDSDMVTIGDAPEVYTVAALYYTMEHKPIYILRTSDNKLFEQREDFCKRYTG